MLSSRRLLELLSLYARESRSAINSETLTTFLGCQDHGSATPRAYRGMDLRLTVGADSGKGHVG
jgi:hypothetical protein